MGWFSLGQEEINRSGLNVLADVSENLHIYQFPSSSHLKKSPTVKCATSQITPSSFTSLHFHELQPFLNWTHINGLLIFKIDIYSKYIIEFLIASSFPDVNKWLLLITDDLGCYENFCPITNQ